MWILQCAVCHWVQCSIIRAQWYRTSSGSGRNPPTSTSNQTTPSPPSPPSTPSPPPSTQTPSPPPPPTSSTPPPISVVHVLCKMLRSYHFKGQNQAILLHRQIVLDYKMEGSVFDPSDGSSLARNCQLCIRSDYQNVQHLQQQCSPFASRAINKQ